MIPIDVDFRLNKYGSFSTDLVLESTDYYNIYEYPASFGDGKGLHIVQKGRELAKEVVTTKLSEIMKSQEIKELEDEINDMSKKRADELSNDEHKMLFVDIDDRTHLISRIRTVHIDFLDLYEEVKKQEASTIADITFSALVEYCFYLSSFFMKKRFKNIETAGDYDFDAYMFDYYFLYNLEQIIPILKKQLGVDKKDETLLNKFYQYFVQSIKEQKYPFSIDNKHLKDLIV
ncbi:hypothetical protein GOV04_03030 [Candidatus Woesearchaeota archaeon]|nr:hypothetical protein [Candidatus Woesearchaeota archaeon]